MRFGSNNHNTEHISGKKKNDKQIGGIYYLTLHHGIVIILSFQLSFAHKLEPCLDFYGIAIVHCHLLDQLHRQIGYQVFFFFFRRRMAPRMVYLTLWLTFLLVTFCDKS